MLTRHILDQLAAHLDGKLAHREARHAESHLRQCLRCRAELEQVRTGMAAMEQLARIHAPNSIWLSIEAKLNDSERRRRPAAGRWVLAFAAALVIALVSVAWWRFLHDSGPGWEVVQLDGLPIIGAKTVRRFGRIGAGEWIETDANSRAAIRVGAIGSVELEPNTSIRVVKEKPDEHRLALARGEIRATIIAPPKLFFVDTASGTVVDLGCEYVLKIDEEGAGLLTVTKGWVAFEWQALESLVPAGASCRTRPHAGPGVPFFDDAPQSLKNALEILSSGKPANDVLSIILTEARVRDTLTLWHLLSRVQLADRERVFDRMAVLTPLPQGVSREQVLKLDPQTLKLWREELAWTW